MSTQIVGLLAGSLTTAAWIPQLVRTWRSGSTEDISWPYLLVFAAGVSGWIFYAVLSDDAPVLAANAVSILLIGSLVELKGGGRLRMLFGASGPVSHGDVIESHSAQCGSEMVVDKVDGIAGVAQPIEPLDVRYRLNLLVAVAAGLHAQAAAGPHDATPGAGVGEVIESLERFGVTERVVQIARAVEAMTPEVGARGMDGTTIRSFVDELFDMESADPHGSD